MIRQISLNVLKHFNICLLQHAFNDPPSHQNSTLAFTFFLHRALRSAKDERSETSHVFLGHTHSPAYVSRLLDSQDYFKAFQIVTIGRKNRASVREVGVKEEVRGDKGERR